MNFCGLGKVFSTKDEGQYEAIGAFWNFMAQCYGRENLRGLGYGWTEDSITYVIGLKTGALSPDPEKQFPGTVWQEIILPDTGWIRYHGETENLPQLYDRIYAEGILKYEIEQFFEDGTCVIQIIRA